MAKRITLGKREREKLKQTKRQDKQKKKEERLSGGSRSFEDMLAYVDENGVLHTTPQDVKPKEEIDASQIEISVPRQSEIEEEEPMSGRVEYFTASKGYGFIKDAAGSEKYFFHITNAPAGIAEGDRVTFELERGTRGMNAVRIVIRYKVTTKKRNAERYSDRIELQGFQSCFRLFVKPSQSPLKPNQDAATLLVRNHARNGDKRTRITKQGVKD